MSVPDMTVHEVAAQLSTSPATVRGLIHAGSLRAYRLTGTRGSWRVPADALEDYRMAQSVRDPWVRTQPHRRNRTRRTA